MSKGRSKRDAELIRLRKRQAREFARRRREGGTRTKIKPLSGRNNRRFDIFAPPNFSLIGNPVGTVGFLNFVRQEAVRRKVQVNFDRVSRITPDAAMALAALMQQLPSSSVSGNLPKEPTCRALLVESGFFDHVTHRLNIAASSNGMMGKRASKQVEGSLAAEMISLGTKAIFGTSGPSTASYRVLVEAMQNTCNHAGFDAKSRIKESLLEKQEWWAMVSADTARKKVCFAFLDTGVGVFRSAKLTRWRKLDRMLRDTADQDLLSDIMKGRISSRTGLPYRGKGLPSMKKLSDDGEIESLTILTNGVHADVANDVYTNIGDTFKGTLLYWEIS